MSHEPKVHEDGTLLDGKPMPMRFALRGPHEHDETEAYVCRLCGVVYVEGPNNLCVKKLEERVSAVSVRVSSNSRVTRHFRRY